jgi:hypothetical protein
MDTLATVRFVTRRAAGIAIERTTARELLQRLVDSARSRSDEEAGLLDRGTHLRALEDREVHLLETLAGRLRRAGADDADAFAVYNNAQDHVVQLGRAHVERVVLEAFVAAIARCPDPGGKRLLNSMCDLYVLSCIDADKAWFLEHGRLTPSRSKGRDRGDQHAVRAAATRRGHPRRRPGHPRRLAACADAAALRGSGVGGVLRPGEALSPSPDVSSALEWPPTSPGSRSLPSEPAGMGVGTSPTIALYVRGQAR